ncbi:acetyltransferase [Thalassovita mediterranea]|nr:acetyltransferase [Thalassovita mediterranea]
MSTEIYDILSNRKATKWTKAELAARVLWEILRRPLFSWTPRQFWWFRRIVLRLFGARVGAHVHIHPTADITVPWHLHVGEAAAIGDRARIYNLGLISIGARSTVSQHAHLCAGTHDYAQSGMPLLKTPISIGADVWVCADAFVGPGVKIGNGAVIAARAVAVSDAPERSISAGNPARVIKLR